MAQNKSKEKRLKRRWKEIDEAVQKSIIKVSCGVMNLDYEIYKGKLIRIMEIGNIEITFILVNGKPDSFIIDDDQGDMLNLLISKYL